MASVFRATYKRPLPPEHMIITRNGCNVVKWKVRGQTRSAPLSDDGTQVVMEYRDWYYSFIDFVDGKDKRVTRRGVPDKEMTVRLAHQDEDKARRKRAGLHRHDEEKAAMPLADALDAWTADLERRGKSKAYRYNMRLLMNQMADGCGWKTLASIRSDTLTAWLASPERVHRRGAFKGQRLSARSLNQYLETAQTFVCWCCNQKPAWLEGNPLSDIEPSDEAVKCREKRALTLDELARLKAAAGRRWPVYLMAALTGLRRSELRRLQWGDVHLDAVAPYIQLRAAATKAKRADVVPINAELQDVLRGLRPIDVPDDQPVFARLPKYGTYRKDVEQRAKIPWRDAQGRLASFHALRKTFGTYLALANVPRRVAMDLMRVTDAKLLDGVYTEPTRSCSTLPPPRPSFRDSAGPPEMHAGRPGARTGARAAEMSRRKM